MICPETKVLEVAYAVRLEKHLFFVERILISVQDCKSLF